MKQKQFGTKGKQRKGEEEEKEQIEVKERSRQRKRYLRIERKVYNVVCSIMLRYNNRLLNFYLNINNEDIYYYYMSEN